MTARWAAAAVLAAAACASRPSAPRVALPPESMEFLRTLALDTIEASRAPRDAARADDRVITPAGLGGYPAFWIRDFSMIADGGLLGDAEIERHLERIARAQSAADRKLASGLEVPAGAIPDHIRFDGGAVFFPGTYSSGDDQGDGTYGRLPPADDHYEFIHVAYALRASDGFVRRLLDPAAGAPLIERLRIAFAVPESDPRTGAVVTRDAKRSVGFGFCDGVVLTGSILFATLLRERAAGELSELHHLAGDSARAEEYANVARTIRAGLEATFAGDAAAGGFLLAATETGRQSDVWGSLYALHRGVLSPRRAEIVLDAVVDAYRRGVIALDGGVRHVPTDRDWSASTAWERTANEAKDTYQNGAYWHVPAGWLVEALARRDPALARDCFDAFIAHLRREDFRLGGGRGAPWECFGRDGTARQNGAYAASVALPYGVLRALAAAR